MKVSALDIAISEATRFLACASELKAELKENETRKFKRYSLPERSALRRASMDLTRALAKYRKAPAW